MGKTQDLPADAHFHTCQELNISSCIHTTDNNQFVLTVYNPSAQKVNSFVRVPVKGSVYSVKNYEGQ